MTAIRQRPFIPRQRTRMTDVMWVAVALAALAASLEAALLYLIFMGGHPKTKE